MTPSWYDLLDVEPTASADEVRAAWRARVADLDPTDRRFAVLNEAAAVLLDPQRRAAHDAELAGRDAPASGAPAAPSAPTAPVSPPPAEPAPADAPAPRRSVRLRRGATAAGATTPAAPTGTRPTTTTDAGADAGAEVEADGARTGRLPWWVPALLAALAIAVVGAATWFALTVPSDDEVLSGTRTAQATAERAIVPVLSYDFETLEEDRADAVQYLTDDFRDDYERLFTQIEENAPTTRTVVEAEVRASAITRGGADRVQVLLFVDQVTTNAQTTEPVTYRNQVTVTMQEVDGRWLVDDLQTTRG
ncbi:J domain-containing protein [Nocardioides perillae]|uniref:Mce-associated membrane protein n=1 Tax=Nocardioides perillae TaxID=1119534 RepID=A0A7Y9RX69_9ACTN|nr:DnaJ domain-containing protein [Nocardioides perillae]NYG57076.1 Mce-associated membrane protein [Nocardioides perillae]